MPIRARARALAGDPSRVTKALATGAQHAHGMAKEAMMQVKKIMGLD